MLSLQRLGLTAPPLPEPLPLHPVRRQADAAPPRSRPRTAGSEACAAIISLKDLRQIILKTTANSL
jgi:hypothetical protein